MFGCRHKWTEVRRRYTSGLNTSDMKAKGLTQETLNHILYGFTSVEMRCDECKNIKFVTQNGDQTFK